MRLWPGRLRVQLVLLVLATLALAQAVTLWLVFDERALAVRAALGLEAAGRAAALARLVADAPEAMRPRILAAASSPSAHFTIDGAPAADPSADGRERALARRVEATLAPWPAGPVRADLRRLRGAPPPMAGMAPRMGRDMARMHRRMAAFPGGHPALAELRLSIPLDGGDWLNLVARFRRPALQWAWPAVLGFALSALALGLVLWLALARITRPLAALAGAADRLGRGEQVAALSETGPEEARRLTAAFNRMQAHLTAMIDERTRLLAALGHDLRSPITALRVRAEMVEDDETRSRMIATLDEMQEMVEAVLAFSRGIARSEPEEPIELEPFLRELAEDAQAAPVDVPEGLTVTARAGGLRRALRNLIDNAGRYGGGAEVAARAVDGGVAITISDRGPGIPEDQLEAVFEPFRRLETSRSRETGGTGLGLAIARAVAKAHGGGLTLANRAGGGLVATLVLPAGAGAPPMSSRQGEPK